MPTPTNESLEKAISSALRFNRFEDAINKLPGAPNRTAIMSSREMYRYKDAIELLKQAEKMRNEAVKDIVAELRGDWDDRTIARAFSE